MRQEFFLISSRQIMLQNSSCIIDIILRCHQVHWPFLVLLARTSAWETHFDEPINVIFLNIFTANRVLAGGVDESEPRNVLTCFANSDCRQCFALRKLKLHQNTSGMATVCVVSLEIAWYLAQSVLKVTLPAHVVCPFVKVTVSFDSWISRITTSGRIVQCRISCVSVEKR